MGIKKAYRKCKKTKEGQSFRLLYNRGCAHGYVKGQLKGHESLSKRVELPRGHLQVHALPLIDGRTAHDWNLSNGVSIGVAAIKSKSTRGPQVPHLPFTISTRYLH